VLFGYLASHLANHALGLVSIAAAETGLRIAMAVWHSAPGTLLLYGAAATHLALALGTLCSRRLLRMPASKILRVALGFGMPLLLIGHFATTRAAFELYGVAPDYHRIVWMLFSSGGEGRQLALLAPGWVHGCLGLNFAFGRRPLWRRRRGASAAGAGCARISGDGARARRPRRGSGLALGARDAARRAGARRRRTLSAVVACSLCWADRRRAPRARRTSGARQHARTSSAFAAHHHGKARIGTAEARKPIKAPADSCALMVAHDSHAARPLGCARGPPAIKIFNVSCRVI
jgi:hypothetical protein